MTDLGLPMSDAMALACHERRKTVTRRPIVPGRGIALEPGSEWNPCLCREIDPADTPCFTCQAQFGSPLIRGSGIAEVGQTVWIRECWQSVPKRPIEAAHRWWTEDHDWPGADGPTDRRNSSCCVIYRASWSGWSPGWRPSIHMPRWAARTTGILTSVRAVRWNDCDDAEAALEGFGSRAEFLAALTTIYPGADWFWRLEWRYDV